MTTTATKPSAAFKTWSKRLEAYSTGVMVPESMFAALCSRFRGRAADERPEDLLELLERTLYGKGYAIGWRITPAQTEKGLAWLRRKAVYNKLPDYAQRIVDNFRAFTFDGVALYYRDHGFWAARPVYVVHDCAGNWFAYTANPFQSATHGVTPFQILDHEVDE